MTDPATPALCDRVAAEVMGWTRAERDWAYSDAAALWHSPDGVPLLPCAAWRPDEDDGQAQSVVDRMTALGFRYEIAGDAAAAAATFTHPDGRSARVRAPDRRAAVLGAAVEAVAARASA